MRRFRLAFTEGIRLRHYKRLRRRLKAYQKSSGTAFVHGSGKRKTALQKRIEKLDEAIRRIRDYTQKLHIAGNYTQNERFVYNSVDKLY